MEALRGRTVGGPSTGARPHGRVGGPAHADRGRRPRAPGGPDRPPSPLRPGWPAVPPSGAPPDGDDTGRALLAAHQAPGLDPPGPRGSPRPTSRPGRFATGSRAVQRRRPPPVAGVPTPRTPGSRRADVHGPWVEENAGRTSGPRPPPEAPTATSRPMGAWGALRGRRLPPAGTVLGPSAQAGGSVSAASLALLRRGQDKRLSRRRSDPQDNPLVGGIN
jgi:hypothetical protein